VGLIERPRLLELVTQVRTKRLSVIKAPAGFGKTSLAVEWAGRLAESGDSVAWFSIDANDNQATQFLFYVSQALQRARDGLGGSAIDLILETSLISPATIVSTLINGLAEIDEEVYLFLEDYHWLSDPAIHDAVGLLLRHAPSHFHLVLLREQSRAFRWLYCARKTSCWRSTRSPCVSILRKRGCSSSARVWGRWNRRN